MINKHHIATYFFKKALKYNFFNKNDQKLISDQNINNIFNYASKILNKKNNLAVKKIILYKIKSLMNEEDAKKYSMEDLEKHLAKLNLIK